MKKGLLCIAAVCLLLILPAGLHAEDAAKEASYQRAVEFMEAGDYDLAISVFEMLGDYSDSVAQIAVCRNEKSGSTYEHALALMEGGSYDAAKEIFLSLGDYKDSAARAVECDTGKKQNQYEMALELAEKGQYEKAKAVFSLLGTYADSEDQVKLMEDSLLKEDYEAAVALQEAGAWEKAIAALEALGDYGDCAERISACRAELEKEEMAAQIRAALNAKEFSAGTVYPLLQEGRKIGLDPEKLDNWLRDAWNLETSALCGAGAPYTDADLDGDGVVERTAAGNGQLFLLRKTEDGLEQLSSQAAEDVSGLETVEDPSGRQYLLTKGGSQVGIWLFEEDWKCITLEETDGKRLFFETTGSGFLLKRRLTEEPLREQTTEYIVISGEQFSPLPYPVEVDYATYPAVDTADTLLALYREAGALGSAEEQAALVSPRADAASMEELDAWLAAHERLERADMALWDPEEQAVHTCLRAGGEEFWTTILPGQDGGLLLGGSAETLAPASGSGEAPVCKEIEAGTTWDVPQSLCANAWTEGELTFDEDAYEYDEDYYRLTLPGAGEVNLQVKHEYMDNSYAVLSLQVRPAGTDTVLWSREVTGDTPQAEFRPLFLGAGVYDVDPDPE